MLVPIFTCEFIKTDLIIINKTADYFFLMNLLKKEITVGIFNLYVMIPYINELI
jgi:hypothetical protein